MRRFASALALLAALALPAPALAGGPGGGTLRATRMLTETYPCDGVPRLFVYTLSSSVGGHPPISGPVRIMRMWAGNYTAVNDNVRVAAFRQTVDGAPTGGDLLYQMFPGSPQHGETFPAPGFRLSPGDPVVFDVVCWGGGLQTTAVWMTYEEVGQP